MLENETQLLLQSLRLRPKNLGSKTDQEIIDNRIFEAILKNPNQPRPAELDFSVWILEQGIPLTHLLGVRKTTDKQLNAVRNIHAKHKVNIKVDKKKVTRSKKIIASAAAREIAMLAKSQIPSSLPNWDFNRVLPSPIHSTIYINGSLPENNFLQSLIIWQKYYILLLIDKALEDDNQRSTLISSLMSLSRSSFLTSQY